MSLVTRLAAAATFLLLGSAAGSAGAQEPEGEIWDPAAGITFQIQLQGRIDTSVEADAYDVDMFDTPVEKIERLHEAGRKVICYISAGTWENWRPDKDQFPKRVLGKKVEGWPGERWLDIRRVGVLRPLMHDRVEQCARKDFDAVEFDNVNGYQNPTGFSLSRRDQIDYNKMLAEVAHEHKLAIGLKNTQGLIDELEPVYDFAINESCYQYDECEPYESFIANDKPVFVIEYKLDRSRFCDKAEAAGFTALRKRLDLKAWARGCWQD